MACPKTRVYYLDQPPLFDDLKRICNRSVSKALVRAVGDGYQFPVSLDNVVRSEDFFWHEDRARPNYGGTAGRMGSR